MIELVAPAKINLHLSITGRDARGYHLLDTSFVFVDVHDVLHVDEARNIEVSCSDAGLSGEDNLVHRVLHALREHQGVSKGLHVHVEKHLPSQAGLGGGSSDAATAMLAANRLWGLGLSGHELADFAAPFGADIPCFLFGRASLAEGIGERLRPLDAALGGRAVALAHPGVGLSTAAVFARFDDEHKLRPGQLTPHRVGATMRAGLKAAFHGLPEMPFRPGDNALEAVSGAMCPELSRLLEDMRRMQSASWMSGSGTACVALCDSDSQATAMTEWLAEQGLARWTHAGRLLERHPLLGSEFQPNDWGVAKW